MQAGQREVGMQDTDICTYWEVLVVFDFQEY
jgi:hypothetical protein